MAQITVGRLPQATPEYQTQTFDTLVRELEQMIARDQEVPAGMIKGVAQHIYNIETDFYPEDIRPDLNKTKKLKPINVSASAKDFGNPSLTYFS